MKRSLKRDESGLALIEFALSLPLLLVMGLGGLEVASFGIASLRVSQIAMTAADNAGRVRNQITEADINEVMAGAKFVGTKIGFAEHGRLILSSLETRSSDGTKQWIHWQRCFGLKSATSSYGVPRLASDVPITDATEDYDAGTTPATPATQSNEVKSVPTNGSSPTPATGMGPPGKQIAAAPGSAVMVVEVVYDYQPIVGAGWINEHEISAVRAYNVRQRNDQVLKPGGLTRDKRARCNKLSSDV